MILLHSRDYDCFIFNSLKRIQPLPVCAGFFICIRNSLDRPCVTMPSWSSPLKCKVSLYYICPAFVPFGRYFTSVHRSLWIRQSSLSSTRWHFIFCPRTTCCLLFLNSRCACSRRVHIEGHMNRFEFLLSWTIILITIDLGLFCQKIVSFAA
jgi:hypothetical protein